MKIPISAFTSNLKQPYISNILSPFCSCSVLQRKVWLLSSNSSHSPKPYTIIIPTSTLHYLPFKFFPYTTEIFQSSLCEKKIHFTIFLVKASHLIYYFFTTTLLQIGYTVLSVLLSLPTESWIHQDLTFYPV